MVKICALASTYDVPIVPHGHSVPANIHLIAAMPENVCPLVEYLVKWNALLQFFWTKPVVPVDGTVRVPEGPGMGMELDPAKIEAEEELRWAGRPNMAGSVQEARAEARG